MSQPVLYHLVDYGKSFWVGRLQPELEVYCRTTSRMYRSLQEDGSLPDSTIAYCPICLAKKALFDERNARFLAEMGI